MPRPRMPRRAGTLKVYMLNKRNAAKKSLFIISLLYEYSNLKCIRIYVIYMVTQAECVIRIRMTAPQEYVNTYSTRRVKVALCA